MDILSQAVEIVNDKREAELINGFCTYVGIPSPLVGGQVIYTVIDPIFCNHLEA